MVATSVTEEHKREEVIDDLDNEKLAALKAKSKAKQEEKMTAKIIAKKERSLEFGVIGTGQAGSNIAQVWGALGYAAVAINTCLQDLKFIDLPDDNKLMLEFGVGGASKERSLGAAAAEAHKEAITELINNKLGNSQINILATSLGGGSGSGSIDVIIDILSEIGKPIIVMACLPQSSDDAHTKSNSLEALSRLSKLVQAKKIANLLIVDNAKIENIYSNESHLNLFTTANKAIVNPLDAFNTFSAMPSSSKALDPMEFSKLLIASEGLSIYGELTVNNYEEDTAIAEAIINNLSSNLLADGFNLKESSYVGFIIAANKNVWDKIPSASVNYASSMLGELCSSPKGIFKGVYVTNDTSDSVKIYSFFGGLGLPETRVNQLKTETKELQSKIKVKDDARNLTLNLDTGENETISAAQKIKDKIAAKSSTFGKFLGNTVDRRKK